MKIFETFKCSGQKFVKFLISVLKWPVNSFSNFASFFIDMTHNSSMDCKLILFYFGLRDPIKVPILKLSSALVKICHILHFIFQTTKKYSLYFLGQTLNTLHNRGKWKCNFWSGSGQIKFRQILIIFETKDQFFFKFCINLQGHEI